MMARKRNAIHGHLERLATCYRWHVSIAGQRHKETIRTTDRREADEYAVQRYAELRKEARSRRGAPRGLERMSDLIPKFREDKLPLLAPSTQTTYGHSLDAFSTFFVENGGDPLVADVQSGDVLDYISWRRVRRRGKAKVKATVSPRTLAKDRATMHALFEFAIERNWRDANPVAKTSAPEGDDRRWVILTAEQYEALIAAGKDPTLQLYAIALGETGGRCESEILWLQWNDVDFGRSRIEIVSGRGGHRTKGGKSRFVPMTPRLAEAMRDHFAAYRFRTYGGEQTPWVFHHARTRRHYKAGQRIKSMRRSLATAAKNAELPGDFRPHDLRHRRVTAWLAQGGSLTHVQMAVGHSDPRTTMKYTHLVDEHVDALLGLEKKLEAATKAS